MPFHFSFLYFTCPHFILLLWLDIYASTCTIFILLDRLDLLSFLLLVSYLLYIATE